MELMHGLEKDMFKLVKLLELKKRLKEMGRIFLKGNQSKLESWA